MALTDISGIGAKTAEKLREKGIRDKQELFRRFKRGDSDIVGGPGRSGLNSRALKGIRDEISQGGEQFIDPVYGVPVTEDNKQAREAFDLDLGSDVAKGFGQFTRENPRYQGMNVLDAAGKAIKGDLGGLNPGSYDEIATQNDIVSNEGPRESDEEATARKEAFEFGLDAATNLSPYERETIESGNDLAQQTAGIGMFTMEQTTTEMRETSQGEIEAEEKMQIDAREYARARNFQESRSRKARRVDNRKDAPVTDEITTWKEDPSHWDYPGIDTPGGRQDITLEERREQARSIDETVRKGDEQVTEIAFGNPLEDLV